MEAVYDELLSLTASTIFHSGSDQLYPNISIIEADDSGTTDEEMELAADFNKTEMRGIRNSSDLIITKTCATH